MLDDGAILACTGECGKTAGPGVFAEPRDDGWHDLPVPENQNQRLVAVLERSRMQPLDAQCATESVNQPPRERAEDFLLGSAPDGVALRDRAAAIHSVNRARKRVAINRVLARTFMNSGRILFTFADLSTHSGCRVLDAGDRRPHDDSCTISPSGVPMNFFTAISWRNDPIRR